jgi:hypothetical protein
MTENLEQKTSFDSFIDRLKELRRKYDSKELDADSTFIELTKIDDKFEESPYYDDEDLADQFCDIYCDLYNECREEMEFSEERRRIVKELEMKKITPTSVIERLRDLKQRYESGGLRREQASAELRRAYKDFKTLECGPNKRGLNEFCDLYLDLENICDREIEPEEKQEDFTAKLWVLKIDEIEAKARDEITTVTNEEILSLYRAHCNDRYFGSKRKYDFLRRELKANPNKEFAAVKYLFEEYCQQLEVLEQVRRRRLTKNNNIRCKN